MAEEKVSVEHDLEQQFNQAEASLGTGLQNHIKTLEKELGSRKLFNAFSPAQVKRWGLENPMSVLNLLPEDLQNRIMALPDELVKLEASELEERSVPSRIDRRVRIGFWEEYERASRKGRPMDLTQVIQHTGLSSWAQYEFRLEKSERLAWLLAPPPAYATQIREVLEVGVNRLHEIINLPLRNGEGEVDPRIGALILAAYKLVDARVHGSVLQRTLAVNVNTPVEHTGSTDPLTAADIDEKIAELERALARKRAEASGTNEIISVDSDDISDAEVVE